MELLVRDFPRNGIVLMWGQLQSMNIFVTRQRVHQSLLRLSPEYVHHRHSSTTSRRVYNVPSSNYFTGYNIYHHHHHMQSVDTTMTVSCSASVSYHTPPFLSVYCTLLLILP